jgi:hypothetical protein
MARHLALPEPSDSVETAVQDHLDASLHHHIASTAGPEAENPIVALAAAVWNAGRVDLGVVPGVVADALARGWFRPPVDAELLTRARAQVVELRELVRRRSREAEAQKQAQARRDAAEREAAEREAADAEAHAATGDDTSSSCHG